LVGENTLAPQAARDGPLCTFQPDMMRGVIVVR
jgi:hypothetical protein